MSTSPPPIALSNRLSLRGLRLILCLPGVEPALQGCGFEPQLLQLPRHPGAGSLIRSGAVGDDALSLDLTTVRLLLFSHPVVHLVRRHPDCAGDAGMVLFVLRAGTDVENYGWVVFLQHQGELIWFDPDRLARVSLEDTGDVLALFLVRLSHYRLAVEL